jgi:hypothetical protein
MTPLVIGCGSPTEQQYMSFPEKYTTPLIIGYGSPIERPYLSLAAPRIQSGNKTVSDRWMAAPTYLLTLPVSTIQKQRSIHNHHGSLAITGNGQGL